MRVARAGICGSGKPLAAGVPGLFIAFVSRWPSMAEAEGYTIGGEGGITGFRLIEKGFRLILV